MRSTLKRLVILTMTLVFILSVSILVSAAPPPRKPPVQNTATYRVYIINTDEVTGWGTYLALDYDSEQWNGQYANLEVTVTDPEDMGGFSYETGVPSDACQINWSKGIATIDIDFDFNHDGINDPYETINLVLTFNRADVNSFKDIVTENGIMRLINYKEIYTGSGNAGSVRISGNISDCPLYQQLAPYYVEISASNSHNVEK